MAAPYRHPAAPFTVPANGNLDQRFAAIATELNKKMDSGIAGPGFYFLGLVSPNGTSYRLFVDDAGALHTELVDRA